MSNYHLDNRIKASAGKCLNSRIEIGQASGPRNSLQINPDREQGVFNWGEVLGEVSSMFPSLESSASPW